MTDQQGANIVGSYGKTGLETFSLDRMAATGVTFKNAYTTCPVCTPARSGIFTGQYGSRNGAWANNLSLGRASYTMGQFFRKAGYRTAFIGKWHLDGSDYFGDGSCPEGWEEAYWYDGRRYLNDLSTKEIEVWRTGSDDDLKHKKDAVHSTWAYKNVEKARTFLQDTSADDKPFLLVVSFDEPHHPSVCPYEYIERFKDYNYHIGPSAQDNLSNKPIQQQMWAEAHDAYQESNQLQNPRLFGCNAFLDTQIGRLLESIENVAAKKPTYIFYTSDHGDMLGAHRLTGKGWCMYEENIKVPLFVTGPDLSSGCNISSPISHIDLLPTFLDIAGIPSPPILEGSSFLSLLKNNEGSNQSESNLNERPVFTEFNRFAINHDEGSFFPIRMIRKGTLKLIINLFDIDELYDLEKDPYELENLIYDSDYTVERNNLHRELLSWMNDRRDPFRGWCWQERKWNSGITQSHSGHEQKPIDSSNNSKERSWCGLQRYRPDDGFRPPVLDYFSGRPADGKTSKK
jgi:uncharacterized sulfatase